MAEEQLADVRRVQVVQLVDEDQRDVGVQADPAYRLDHIGDVRPPGDGQAEEPGELHRDQNLLGSLGMGIAFGPYADFTGSSPKAGSIGLVVHAATLRVDEQGTVASAPYRGGRRGWRR